MKKIGNIFSKIGTNPHKYIENYLLYFSMLGCQEIIKIRKDNFSFEHQGIEIINFNSDATFRQNIDCWLGLGFFIRKNNVLVKIIDTMNESDFYEYIKAILFVPTNIKSINIYRDTILIKLMNLIELETIQKFNLSTRSKKINLKDIKDETGRFENKIINDKNLQNFLKAIWSGEKNE